MDQETKDYLDRRLLALVKREDVEKLRQETNSHLRQWKEEIRTQLLEGIQEIKTGLERLGEGEGQVKGEILSTLDVFKLGLEKNLQRALEEEGTQRAVSKDEWRADLLQLAKDQQAFREEMKRIAEASSTLHGTVKGGLTELKEELGAMMRFSFADLEKRINALEVRIKALERIAFH